MKKIIQNRINKRDYDFKVGNDLAGKDPAPGVVKVLVIKYKLNGKEFTKTIGENATIKW